ncbi:hypothetical protein FOZ63_023160 [Perkinsus olseni]|uniref:N-acetyltransferase domain-containing protein n=1 Tax=Perkinsus olseni TaxID=32597 RepID=A0A7J6RRU8_PEROL|nr:hypothetical protein FOZ62_003698 [Perkinsus olseni]KAF4723213.1 hypothetical protein FOZ63_023160 [Perkinsus olseni]
MGTTLFATLICLAFPVMTMSLGRRTIVYVGGRRRIKRLPLSNFLEYRPASPVDRIRATQDCTDSAMFVAVETRYPHQPEAVVGSAEFGVVKTPKHGDWVYITNIFAHERYRGEGVEAEILRKLLEYIHEKNPRIIGAWARVYDDDGVFHLAHNFVYTFPPKKASTSASRRGKKSLPVLSHRAKILKSFFDELVQANISDDVYRQRCRDDNRVSCWK